jgi:putative phage-type endonuclease
MAQSREEFLIERRTGIGGSDAAAILGLNPFSTPFTVWADKTGRLPDKEDNEAMRQGRDLEEYVVQRFEEKTGLKCRKKLQTIRNKKYPFALAHIDRWIPSEGCGLECKTTSVMNLKHFKNGEYPDSYYCQCVHYMAVTGAPRWHLAVLVLNQGFYTFVIERDEGEIDALMSAEAEFWSYVETDTPPPLDGSDATTAALNAIYAESDGGAVELFGRETVVREHQELKKEIAELRTRQKLLAQILKTDMQSAEIGECGPYTVRWKNSVRASVSLDLLRKRYPKLDLSKVMTAQHSRRFSIREQEESH